MTPIDPTLIETLLNMSEGDTLDFKRDQYPVSGATDEQKSELVKDVLAFANGWKTTDAFIIVGADENPGGRASVVGISGHLNDADVQQLVNAKTNRPVHFEYVPVTVDGLHLGILRVRADQQRPIFLAKPFGKLKPNVVYLRRGSSTAEAGPDEIARMGSAAVTAANEPSVSVELGDPEHRKPMGTTVILTSTVLRDPPPLPELIVAQRKMMARFKVRSPFEPDRKAVANHKRGNALLSRVGFRVENVGRVLVEDARLVVHIPRMEHLRAVDEFTDDPTPPDALRTFPRVRGSRYTRVKDLSDSWEVLAVLGKIQPSDTVWSLPFWVGSSEACELPLVARLFGDNIGKAVEVPLNLQIQLAEGLLERAFVEDDE